MKMPPKTSSLGHLIRTQLFTLHYFQQVVSRYGVHYDPHKYGRVHQTWDRFCLFQYRQLYPEKPKRANFPLYISKGTTQLQMLIWFFGFYLLRGIVILYVKRATDTKKARILVGTEMWQSASTYFETTLLLWSIMIFGYLKFSLTTSLLDYKFLAILSMSDSTASQYHMSLFGLGLVEYRKLKLFKSLILCVYYYIMCTIPVFAAPIIGLLFVRASLFETNPLNSSFWLFMTSWFAFHGCSVLYSNLAIFLITAKYIQIKQKSIASQVAHCLSRLVHCQQEGGKKWQMVLWHKRALSQCTRYSYLQEELYDCNRFWSSALTFAFVVYCSLVAYILYIILFARTLLYMKYLYGLILYFHVLLLLSIMQYSASLVLTNKRLFTLVNGQLARLLHSSGFTFRQLLRLQHLGPNLKQTLSGFTLLNGYLITYETFQLIIINIAIYFMLAFHI